MSGRRKVVMGGLMILAVLMSIAEAARADDWCDLWRMTAFDQTCGQACRFGWNSAFANQSCLFDILLSYT